MSPHNKHRKAIVNYQIKPVPVDLKDDKSIWDHVNKALNYQDFGRYPDKKIPARFIQFGIIKGLRDYDDSAKTEDCLQILRELQGKKTKNVAGFSILDLQEEPVFNNSFWSAETPKYYNAMERLSSKSIT